MKIARFRSLPQDKAICYVMFLIFREFQSKSLEHLSPWCFLFPATQVDHVVNFQMPMGALGWRSILAAFFFNGSVWLVGEHIQM